MKKIITLIGIASLLTLGFVGCDDDKDSNDDNKTGTGTGTGTVNVGDSCNANTFKEVCDSDGHSILACEESKVVKYDCQDSFDEDYNPIKDTHYICATSTSETNNVAFCVYNDPSNVCDTVHATDKECGYDWEQETFEVEYTYSCIAFDNGNKYWIASDETFCSGRCSDGCIQTTCTPGAAPKCSGEVATNCTTSADGSLSVWVAEDCASYEDGLKCFTEDDEAFCDDPE